jgi:hypothetical protein
VSLKLIESVGSMTVDFVVGSTVDSMKKQLSFVAINISICTRTLPNPALNPLSLIIPKVFARFDPQID